MLLHLLLSLLLAAGAPASSEPPPEELQEQATQAFDENDFAEAARALEQLLEKNPDSPPALYNLACAQAQLGELAAAEQSLIDAISHGFIDFHHMVRDPHLAPLRGRETFETIRLGWRDLLDARADANMEAAKRIFDSRYLFRRDGSLRLIFAAAFDEITFEQARTEIDRVADWAFKTLFSNLGPDEGADPTPDPWVTVILPAPEDFMRMSPGTNVGGFYDHDRRRLVSQDVGPSFRHEFFHVLHWRDMTRRGQKHPDWIMEGLASVVEDIEIAPDGGLVPAPSWRTNIVKRLERANRLLSFEELATMDRRRFVTRRPNAHYAQARALMMYLFHVEHLGAWYQAYVEGYDEDPTGVEALRAVFDEPLQDVESRYRAWIRSLPEAVEELRPGMASLGVVVSPGRGDGPRIQQIPPGSEARRDGLRLGDVIEAIDGMATRTTHDILRAVADREPGERVEVSVRRGTRRLTVQVELIEAE